MEKIEALQMVYGLSKLRPDQPMDKKTVTKVKQLEKWCHKYYSTHVREFIEDFLTITDGTTNLPVPFRLTKQQLQVLEDYESDNWVAVPKARQLGITTLTNALALHHALFSPLAIVRCMAKDGDNAEKNLGRIRAMFRSLPEYLQRILVREDEKQGHRSNNSLWKFHAVATGQDSSIQTASGASEDSTRGDQPTFLHWTETAFSPIADDIYTAVYPGLRRRPGSKIVMESSGKGSAGLFFDVATGVKKGFKVRFLPWYDEPSYASDAELSDQERDAVLKDIGPLNIELSDRQIAWYKETIESMGLQKAWQEYPSTLKQAFQAKSKSFFSPEAMERVGLGEPLRYFAWENGLLTLKNIGPCIIYENPEPEKGYHLYADVSEGVEDPSSINVVDPKGKEVAYWNEKLTPDKLVDVLVALGMFYNNALIVVERNNIGAYVLKMLQSIKRYPNVYWEKGKPGVLTTVSTKPLMLATLQTMLVEGKMTFRNPVMAGEMQIFNAATLKAEKGNGKHDDAVMSAAVGAYVFAQQRPKVHMDTGIIKNSRKQRKRRNFVC